MRFKSDIKATCSKWGKNSGKKKEKAIPEGELGDKMFGCWK